MIQIMHTLLDDIEKKIIRYFETDEKVYLADGSVRPNGGVFREEKPYPDSHHIE